MSVIPETTQECTFVPDAHFCAICSKHLPPQNFRPFGGEKMTKKWLKFDKVLSVAPEDRDADWMRDFYEAKNKTCISCRNAVRRNEDKRFAYLKKYIDKVKSNNKCMECGYDTPGALTFHHRSGIKIHDVANTKFWHTNGGVEAMKLEMDKCDILCSHCFHIRTRNNRKRKGSPTSSNVLSNHRIKRQIGACQAEGCERKCVEGSECGFHWAHIFAGDKCATVSGMRSGKARDEEIAKCRLLCANCHKLETDHRRRPANQQLI